MEGEFTLPLASERLGDSGRGGLGPIGRNQWAEVDRHTSGARSLHSTQGTGLNGTLNWLHEPLVTPCLRGQGVKSMGKPPVDGGRGTKSDATIIVPTLTVIGQ